MPPAGTDNSRVELRRRVRLAAAAASSPEDFFARLAGAGVLARPRYSERPGQPPVVTSYAVALAGPDTDTDTDTDTEDYVAGGRLAADLSWPRLLAQWTPVPTPAGSGSRRRRRPVPGSEPPLSEPPPSEPRR